MNGMILHFDDSEDWCIEQWLLNQGGKENPGYTLFLLKDDGWLAITHDLRILNDYDDEDVDQLFSLIDPTKIYLLEWRGDSMISWFMANIPRHVKGVIDNDFGIICYLSSVTDLPLNDWLRQPKLG